QIYVCSLPHQKRTSWVCRPSLRGGPKGPPFFAPLSVTACGRASSPAGGAKCTFVHREKLCGKMNFFVALPYHKVAQYPRACTWLSPWESWHSAPQGP